jgi:hypothetical protein
MPCDRDTCYPTRAEEEADERRHGIEDAPADCPTCHGAASMLGHRRVCLGLFP